MSDNKTTDPSDATQSTTNSADQVPGIDEVQKLRDRNQKLQSQISDLEKRFSVYKDIDPEEWRSLKAKLEETEKRAAEKDPAKLEELFEKKMGKFRSEVESEKASLLDELAKLKKANKTLAVTDKVMSEIAGFFNPDAIKFIKREVEELCDLDEDGSIVVRDDSGEVLYKGARPMTSKEFGERLVEKYPSLAKASGVGGGKDQTPGQKNPGRGTNKVPQSWAELQSMPNAREVLERLKKEDPAAVQKILRTISA